MSEKEMQRLRVLKKVKAKLTTQRHAAAMLGVTDRWVCRLLQCYA